MTIDDSTKAKLPHVPNTISGTNVDPELKPIEVTAAYKNKDKVAYELSKQFFNTPRPLKVIVAGAGCSGLDLAHAVESGRLKNVDLRIYEKNAGIGGTWWENRYPGCACDIPSHNYLVRFSPGTGAPLHSAPLSADFTTPSSPGPQIRNGLHSM